jgi:hypothetical protein
LGEIRLGAVHPSTGPCQLLGFNFDHICRISCANGGGHALTAYPVTWPYPLRF